MHVGMLQAYVWSFAIDGEVGMDGPVLYPKKCRREAGLHSLWRSWQRAAVQTPCRAGTAPRDGSRTPLSCMERFLV